MPRKARHTTSTGIYHVMMRGINHQNIFEDEEDNYQFVNTLHRMRLQTDDDGFPCGTNCTIYAYCLMNNHFHLLIRERDEAVGDTIKRIASSYVYYYNRKYLRDGHLFKERFKSEPVYDMDYFTTLLRYIHQNPVKAGIVKNVRNYEFSSWAEYEGNIDPVFQLCDTATVLRRIPFEELKALVDEPLSESVRCIDIEDPSRHRPSDDQVWGYIREATGATSSSAFQKLEDPQKRTVLKELKQRGASHRQLARLTGIGRGLIQKL